MNNYSTESDSTVYFWRFRESFEDYRRTKYRIYYDILRWFARNNISTGLLSGRVVGFYATGPEAMLFALQFGDIITRDNLRIE